MDINKFSLAQACSNTDGKTSGSGTTGLFICVVGGLTLIASNVLASLNNQYTNTIATSAISALVIGAGLLGYRKSKDIQNGEV